MAKDILGRDVPVGAMVVVRGKNENDPISMKLGIFYGEVVECETNTRKDVNAMFLIEHPGPKELEIKEKILERLASEVVVREKADEVGRVYRFPDNRCYLYCGKKMMTIYECGKIMRQEIGHVYLNAGSGRPKRTIGGFVRIETLGLYRGNFPKICENHAEYDRVYNYTIDIPTRIEISGVYTTYKKDPEKPWDRENWVPDKKLDRKVVIEDF